MAGQNFPVAVMARRAAALAGVIRDGGTEVEIALTLREFGEDVSTVDVAAVPLLQQVADELYAVFAAETLDTCVAEINGMLGRWAGPPRCG